MKYVKKSEKSYKLHFLSHIHFLIYVVILTINIFVSWWEWLNTFSRSNVNSKEWNYQSLPQVLFVSTLCGSVQFLHMWQRQNFCRTFYVSVTNWSIIHLRVSGMQDSNVTPASDIHLLANLKLWLQNFWYYHPNLLFWGSSHQFNNSPCRIVAMLNGTRL